MVEAILIVSKVSQLENKDHQNDSNVEKAHKNLIADGEERKMDSDEV